MAILEMESWVLEHSVKNLLYIEIDFKCFPCRMVLCVCLIQIGFLMFSACLKGIMDNWGYQS